MHTDMELRLARWVSQGLHPFLISPLAVLAVLYLDTGSLWQALKWAGLISLLILAPATLYLQRKLARREYSDADVSLTHQRNGFYIFGAVTMLVSFAVVLWLQPPEVLISLFVAGLITLAAAILITRLWLKASIHTGVMAGSAAALAFYSLPLAVAMIGLTLLVAWARVTLRRHTLPEVVVGFTIAAVIVGGVMLYGAANA
jgi:hypothetical protein